ncbi:hypothetical protein [Loktanella sp. SALINAS62]|uniref:hypothetical protein n=1 Tax=Loktanella sp. SALINAS62 TaxID=2706124 RepID=UPI001B8A8E92|nr:hypothetical protein [Loktanella sp. SALINAS62]MBS1303610.1 hypothetical protein [Loktanella sp. SALINAS62]
MKKRFLYMFAAMMCGAAVALPLSAAACPNPEHSSVVRFTESGVNLRRGKIVRLNAGGTSTLAECPQAGVVRDNDAYFTDAPSLELELVGMMGLGLQITPDQGCANSILVLTPDGQWYNRGPGLNGYLPALMLSRPGTGELKVWVGTKSPERCRLRMEVLTIRR